jgi:5-carboxyvanillate decarboxylase
MRPRRSGRARGTPRPAAMNRRAALRGMSAMAASALTAAGNAAGEPEEAQGPPARRPVRLRKIATEEAYTIPEVAEALRGVVRQGGTNLDLKLLSLIYDAPPAPAGTPARPGDRDAQARTVLPRLRDLDAGRLAEMDAYGVDVHLLSLTAPGVQMFRPDTAVALARLANDRLSEAVRRHPTRFAGLACFAPQDPAAAVKEMERAIRTLKLNGFLVNSHTDNLYLDDPRFWPILEAAEALDAPLYIHPRAPSDGMAAPFRDYRMEGAIWGYGLETGTHAVRLMLSGVLDRFPRLRIVLGHMGEALPFWLWRLDFMATPGSRAALQNRLKPSEYIQRNFAITTSGVEDPLLLRLCIDKIGLERVMWAIDYPYQPTPGAVSFIDNAPLSEPERAAVAHGNAARIFRIGAA